jgi:hypothetical protein
MPALSPTMTEGNIATWKIKEGTINPDPHPDEGDRTFAIATTGEDL